MEQIVCTPAGVSLLDQPREVHMRELTPDQSDSKSGVEAGLPSSETHPFSMLPSLLSSCPGVCAVLQEVHRGTGEVRRASWKRWQQNHSLRDTSLSRETALAFSEAQSEVLTHQKPKHGGFVSAPISLSVK